MRLLYILADQRSRRYFANLWDDKPRTQAFTWPRALLYWQRKAAIGLTNAMAVARRTDVAHPPPVGSPPCRRFFWIPEREYTVLEREGVRREKRAGRLNAAYFSAKLRACVYYCGQLDACISGWGNREG